MDETSQFIEKIKGWREVVKTQKAFSKYEV